MGPSNRSHRPWEYIYLISFASVAFLRQYDWSLFEIFPLWIRDIFLTSPVGYIFFTLGLPDGVIISVAALQALILLWITGTLYIKDSNTAMVLGWMYFHILFILHILIIFHLILTGNFSLWVLRIGLTYPLWLWPGWVIFQDASDSSMYSVPNTDELNSGSQALEPSSSHASDSGGNQTSTQRNFTLNEYGERVEEKE